MSGSRDPIRDYLRWRKHEDRVAAAYRWLGVALVAASIVATSIALWLVMALVIVTLG